MFTDQSTQQGSHPLPRNSGSERLEGWIVGASSRQKRHQVQRSSPVSRGNVHLHQLLPNFLFIHLNPEELATRFAGLAVAVVVCRSLPPAKKKQRFSLTHQLATRCHTANSHRRLPQRHLAGKFRTGISLLTRGTVSCASHTRLCSCSTGTRQVRPLLPAGPRR